MACECDIDVAGCQGEANAVSIAEGYATGLIGRITSLEAGFYGEKWQLGRHFEAVIASGLSNFFNRYETGVDAFFRVVHHKEGVSLSGQPSERIMGSLAVDRSGRIRAGEVALRWFFLHPSLHGCGVGKALMERAIAFARETGAQEIVVETFEGLDAACAIYESVGFVLEDRWEGHQWGRALPERRYRLMA